MNLCTNVDLLNIIINATSDIVKDSFFFKIQVINQFFQNTFIDPYVVSLNRPLVGCVTTPRRQSGDLTGF